MTPGCVACVAVWLVWLCGCVAVWLCGCVAVWLCGLCGGVAVWTPGSSPAGGSPCTQVTVLNASAVQCIAPSAPVGRYPVAVSLNNVTSPGNVSVDRLCPEGRFAFAGHYCGLCPQVR